MKLIDLLTNQADPNKNNHKIEILSDPSYARNGTIFTAMRDLGYTPEWLAYEGDPSTYSQRKDKAVSLALDYYLLHGAEKTLTRMAKDFYENRYPAVATSLQSPAYSLPYNMAIARVLIEKFSHAWDRAYEAITAEYNPVDNYNMVEEEGVDTSIKTESSNGIYGFDSSTPIPSTTGETTTSGGSSNNKRKLTRRGNIGVTTSAQMVEGELELRKKHFLDMVYRDIDSLLCLAIYE